MYQDYLLGKRKMTVLKVGRFDYDIEMDTMRQINFVTKTSRKIKRSVLWLMIINLVEGVYFTLYELDNCRLWWFCVFQWSIFIKENIKINSRISLTNLFCHKIIKTSISVTFLLCYNRAQTSTFTFSCKPNLTIALLPGLKIQPELLFCINYLKIVCI